jgi:hypothetical protein
MGQQAGRPFPLWERVGAEWAVRQFSNVPNEALFGNSKSSFGTVIEVSRTYYIN